MFIFQKKERFYLLVLTAIFILYTTFNYIWLSRDLSPPQGDEPIHLFNALRYYHLLRQGHIAEVFLVFKEYYPPLCYHYTALLQLLFGAGLQVSVMGNTLFLAILIFSLFFLGKHLWNEDVGILTAIAGTTFPFIAYLSHKYFLDFPLTAILALSLYLLIRTEGFKHPWWTIGFFISLGVASIIKWTAPFFMILPAGITFAYFVKELSNDKKSLMILPIYLLIILVLVYETYYMVIKDMLDIPLNPGSLLLAYLTSLIPFIGLFALTLILPIKSRSLKFFFLGLILFIVIIWQYYAFNMSYLLGHLVNSAGAGFVENQNQTFFSFWEMFALEFQGIPWSVFLVVGITAYLIGKGKTMERNLMLAGLFSSLIIFYILPNKHNRYLLPTIIFSAPFITFWIVEIKSRVVRYAMLVAFLAFAFIGCFGWLFISPSNMKAELYGDRFPLISRAPDTDDWKLIPIVKKIVEASRGHKTNIIFMEAVNKANLIYVNSLRWAYLLESGETIHFVGGPRNALLPREFQKGDVRLSFIALTNRLNQNEKVGEKTCILFIHQDSITEHYSSMLQIVLQSLGLWGEPVQEEEVDLPNGLKARIAIYEMGIRIP